GAEEGREVKARVGRVLDGLAHARDQPLHVLLEEAAEDRFLRREELVERAERQLRDRGDLDHGAALIALAGEETADRGEDAGTSMRPLACLAAGIAAAGVPG